MICLVEFVCESGGNESSEGDCDSAAHRSLSEEDCLSGGNESSEGDCDQTFDGIP